MKHSQSLRDTVVLSSARGTRQRPKNTRHTTHAICVSANSYLPSVFYRALGKCFAECQIWLDTRQKSSLPSVFWKNTGQRIIVCRVFLGITLSKPIFQRKIINFFLSIPLLFAECFWELHSANLFSKEKNIFFSV